MDVAKTCLEIGRLHELLGDVASAELRYTEAANTLERIDGQEAQLIWIQAVNERAMLISGQGRQPEALRDLRRIKLPKATAGLDRNQRPALALTLNNVAIVLARMERTREATNVLRRAIDVLQLQSGRDDPDLTYLDRPLQSQFADAMSNLS